MFIEVYVIPTNMWTEPASASATKENRKLIALSCIGDIDYSTHCDGRAEIEYCNGKKTTVVGSYDDIVDRIDKAVLTGKIQRV